jgi:RNA polymerase sigma-70 factor (ECF subfamily)
MALIESARLPEILYMGDDSRPDSASDRAADDRDTEGTRELVDRARQGDEVAIERLFARHLRPMQRWASGRLPQWARDVADTDDLVQDALLQTFKRIGDFQSRGVGALQAYLRQAVINRLRDELRRKGRRPDSTDLDDKNLQAAGSPLEQAIGREALEHYEGALQRLKPEERELIVARVEMEYTYEELAQVLGKPSAEAARKAAQRALVRLAEEMKRGRAQPVD